MIGPRKLLHFYRLRLRVHWMQELLAGVGIAVGVALVFAVQVANSSITGSARQVVEGITGTATLQLAAREARGFDDAMLARVRALPAVEHAAPLLEERATIAFGGRDAAIDLVGVDPSLPQLGGIAARNFQLGGLVLQPGVVLPKAVADQLRLPAARTGAPLSSVVVTARGRARQTAVSAVLDRATIGPIESGMLAIASLRYAQQLSGLPRRITRVLVVPRPGQHEHAADQLRRLAGGKLTVASVDSETKLLEQATGPIDQATGLFAAISALVGLLFAFNAMLLTVPERRRLIAAMRKIGYRRNKLILIFGFQAVLLGAVASICGVAGGYVLSQTAAHSSPSYLTFAFPLGIHPVIPVSVVVLSLLGGIVATCAAAAQPLLDLRLARPVHAALTESGEPGQALNRATRRLLALGSLAMLAVTTLLVIVLPSLTVVGVALLAIATVLAIPTAFTVALRLGDRAAQGGRLNALLLAVRGLRATTIRSLALAATGAVAVFGSVAIEGAHRNLVDGLDRNFAEYLSTADLWVTTGGDENSLTTQSFQAADSLERIRAVPGVADARAYYGGLLDLGDRRAWVIGRPSRDRSMVPPSQLVEGHLATVNGRLREGGWVAVSESIARRLGVDVGRELTLPTPSGARRFRVAGTLTNMGWGPGAVVIGDRDYRDAWATADPSAIEIDVRPGADVVATQRAVRAALGRGRGLRVQTTSERNAQFQALARQGLSRLSQISVLLLIAAALAMAAAMAAGIWQRRTTFAQLRIRGFRPQKLWRTLLFETLLVLGTGCVTGAVFGIYGHLLGNRWLQLSTGYPAPFDLAAGQTLATCALVAVVAILITAAPGYLVARTAPRLGLTTDH